MQGVSEDQLLEAGYIKTPPTANRKFLVGNYQKVIRNLDQKILYFIEILLWDFAGQDVSITPKA